MNMNNLLGSITASALLIITYIAINDPINMDTVIDYPVELEYVTVRSTPVREVVNIDDRQLECMALNMYFESRNQKTDDAMIAVGFIVLNRVASGRYRSTPCEVVWQGQQDAQGDYIRNKCQFSWVCDGKADRPNMSHPVEAAAWERSKELAIQVLMGNVDNPVGNAIMYHATYVKPSWRKAYEIVIQIEDHIFYEKV
jgi:spore germination cell wall hydrolase CwlJ-like protein